MTKPAELVLIRGLTGAALDWAVAKCEGAHPQISYPDKRLFGAIGDTFDYSTDWAQGGPIIDREGISTRLNHKQAQLWEAYIWLPTQHDQSEADSSSYIAFGMTPLIAAMRCHALSQLGDEVEVPKGLT